MKHLIYCDGGSRPNPGRGAYAIAVISPAGELIHEQVMVKEQTTNNQMEMLAMSAALTYAFAHPQHEFSIVTDSQYVKNGLLSWVKGWIRNNWINSQKKPVLNKEIWVELYDLFTSTPNVTISWTKGHASDQWNNLVDQKCTDAILNNQTVPSNG